MGIQVWGQHLCEILNPQQVLTVSLTKRDWKANESYELLSREPAQHKVIQKFQIFESRAASLAGSNPRKNIGYSSMMIPNTFWDQK